MAKCYLQTSLDMQFIKPMYCMYIVLQVKTLDLLIFSVGQYNWDVADDHSEEQGIGGHWDGAVHLMDTQIYLSALLGNLYIAASRFVLDTSTSRKDNSILTVYVMKCIRQLTC